MVCLGTGDSPTSWENVFSVFLLATAGTRFGERCSQPALVAVINGGLTRLCHYRLTTAKDKRRARCINYRHVIEGLRRKPRALIYCTWQQDLLPNEPYQQLWQQLQANFDLDSAAVLMVETLYIAATQDKESAVAEYLAAQLAAGTLTLATLQKHFQLLKETTLPTVQVQQHDLKDYDQLLQPEASSEPLPESVLIFV
jgi:hypothetical protein